MSAQGFVICIALDGGDQYVAARDYDPLVGPVPAEVSLEHAPLVRVISQVRFPTIVSIEKREFIGPFQESIRGTYPVLRVEQTRVIMGSQSMEASQSHAVWRFSDVGGKWRASLASSFVALETTEYSNRSDFLQRFKGLLDAVTTHIGPKVADRLGIRYIDRVTGEQVMNMKGLVRREVLGILATPVAAHARHTLSESRFKVPDGKAEMVARWGQLPADITPDPAAIEPISERSWILDVDMFSLGPCIFDPDELSHRAQSYSERIYAFFRWVVTDEFLRQYGGKA